MSLNIVRGGSVLILGGSGGGGAVDSVNSQTGAVVLGHADVGAVADRTDITGLTGGTATDLDSIETVGITVPYTVMILRNGAVEFFTLVEGTDAEDEAGGIVRPDDYATTTNEKVWKAALWFG
jgi:hypothetical protein